MSKVNGIKILLVEDDLSLGFVVQDQLKDAGYNVDLCRNGNDALPMLNENSYSLAILDVMLPGKDGFTLAADIREIDNPIPIIFLTAKGQIEDKVKGFEAGGDDYLVKPFEFDELLVRITARLKRAGEIVESEETSFKIGQFEFDYKNLQLTNTDSKDQRTLTRKEADLLKLFCEHKNEVLEKQIPLKLIWGKDDYFMRRSMDVFVTRLRKYLKADPNITITTLQGIGLKFEVQEA